MFNSPTTQKIVRHRQDDNDKGHQFEDVEDFRPSWLDRLIRPLNSEKQVEVTQNDWGTTPIMAVVILLFLIFLIIILEIYNSSIILENFHIGWM